MSMTKSQLKMKYFASRNSSGRQGQTTGRLFLLIFRRRRKLRVSNENYSLYKLMRNPPMLHLHGYLRPRSPSPLAQEHGWRGLVGACGCNFGTKGRRCSLCGGTNQVALSFRRCLRNAVKITNQFSSRSALYSIHLLWPRLRLKMVM